MFKELRVDTLLKMMEQGRLDQLSVDADQSEKLVKLLDGVVIKLEGGTDMDLLVLDQVQVASGNQVCS